MDQGQDQDRSLHFRKVLLSFHSQDISYNTFSYTVPVEVDFNYDYEAEWKTIFTRFTPRVALGIFQKLIRPIAAVI